jgi:hypothetical protein
MWRNTRPLQSGCLGGWTSWWRVGQNTDQDWCAFPQVNTPPRARAVQSRDPLPPQVSVSDPVSNSYVHLHLEPYEPFWQPSESLGPVRVHGGLYVSEAFVSAHCDLQASLGEPGCNLPKVILALMFASGSTQLTAFSNAKLWPLYRLVGNELKYRLTKPSCNAFEHIAYFETVGKAHKLYVLNTHLIIW